MDPLTIALAIYGGYQGYRSAKKAGAGTLGRVFGTALGAYGGYNLGQGIGSLANAGTAAAENLGTTAVAEGVTQGIGAFNPYANVVDPYVGTSLSTTMDPALTNALGTYNNLAPTGITKDLSFQPLQTLSTTPSLDLTQPDYRLGITQGGAFSPYASATNIPTTVPTTVPTTEKSFLDKATEKGKEAYSYLFEKPVKGGMPGERELDIAKTAVIGLPALTYFSGAFEREPFQRNQFTYNVNYPDLYRSRKFYTQDPKTGEVKELEQQAYIPEEKAKESITSPEQQFGPYKRETITLQQGGLATLNHFRDGGVNYLPSKTIHDEDDEDNYMRVNGYVEDGAGNGNKEEDTMLAQLADGEFVTRTDGVLGAGILAGADPSNAKDMKKKGAEFFYEQQRRFKRIYDLLDANRKATTH